MMRSGSLGLDNYSSRIVYERPSRKDAADGVDDMTKTVWFKVAVRITYDDEKSLRVAMRAVRDELSIE